MGDNMAEEKKETKIEQGSEAAIKQKTQAKSAGQSDLIEQAQSIADKIEKQNKEYSALLDRQEQIEAEKRLGGSTEAGESVKEQTEEEKEIAAAKKQLKGTGYEDMFDPPKEK